MMVFIFEFHFGVIFMEEFKRGQSTIVWFFQTFDYLSNLKIEKLDGLLDKKVTVSVKKTLLDAMLWLQDVIWLEKPVSGVNKRKIVKLFYYFFIY